MSNARVNLESAAALALMPIHAVLAIGSAFAFFSLALLALIGPFFLAEQFLWWEAWSAGSAILCIRNAVASIEGISDHQWRPLAVTLAISGAIVVSSPFW